MQKIFVTYGGGWRYKDTLKRIEKEAKSLGIFDKVICYKPEDMPLSVQASPLKIYERGDGYWSWKPYVIWKTLQDYPSAIVVYADAGCKLLPNFEEWNSWFNLMQTYETITFRYRADYTYPWEQSGECKTTNREWTKKSMIDYFEPLIGNKEWLAESQLWAGCVIAHNKDNLLIRMWLDIMFMRPDLIIDVFGTEVLQQNKLFIDHRHDQSLLSAISTYFENKSNNVVKILPETAESQKANAAVVAARIIKKEVEPIRTRIIRFIKSTIGDDTYEVLRGRRRLFNFYM